MTLHLLTLVEYLDSVYVVFQKNDAENILSQNHILLQVV